VSPPAGAHLPPLDVPQGWPETTWPSFIDEDTILFARWPPETPGIESWMTVGADGTGVRDVPRVDLGGLRGTLVRPAFYSTRDGRVYFPGSANPLGTDPENTCQMRRRMPL